MDFSSIASTSQQAELALRIHNIAMAQGCAFKQILKNGKTIIKYSLRRFEIEFNEGRLLYSGDYDIRAFMKLYRETKLTMIKQLLFTAATSCSYCINDKCTTLLMAEQRTIEYEGKTKKLCGPYRHWIEIEVQPENIEACEAIASMMFEYTDSFMHKNLEVDNVVSHNNIEKGSFYIVGYMARHHALSKSDNEHVQNILADPKKLESLKAVSGKDETRFVAQSINLKMATTMNLSLA